MPSYPELMDITATILLRRAVYDIADSSPSTGQEIRAQVIAKIAWRESHYDST